MYTLKAKTIKIRPSRAHRVSDIILRQAKDHFIPHPGNNHVPHILKHRVLLGYGIIAILLKVLVIVIPIALPSAWVYSSSITSANVISLTNETRKALGLTELKSNPTLAEAAAAKAKDMLANGYFAHTSPSGVTAWSIMAKHGYQYQLAGENLAVHYVSAEGVNEGWLESPTHRANIVNPKFSEIGIGTAEGIYEGYPSIFVVQFFGEPLQKGTVPPPTAVAEKSPDVKIIPHQDHVAIKLAAPKVLSAIAQLGNQSVALTATGDGTWTGDVPFDAASTNAKGELLSVITTSSDQSTPIVTAVATVAPQAAPKDIYAFISNRTSSLKLLGFTIDNLDDSARRFYLYAILFLVSATVISVLVKFHMKHLPIYAHAIVLVVLGVGLMMF